MKIHAMRFHPGQDLKRSLESFVAENAISAGFVITCVGSLERAVLRMANEKGSKVLVEKFEIVSLVGTLSGAGCHLHIALADKSGMMTGGHLQEGCLIFTTAEIVVGEAPDILFTREMDKNTGFKELVVTKQ